MTQVHFHTAGVLADVAGIDLRSDGARDDELARLLAHGAVEVADHRGQYGPGTGWVILADPEGNEFCILRNQAERDDAASADGTVEGS